MKDRRKGHPTGIDLDDESQAKETSEMAVEQHRNYNYTKSSIHVKSLIFTSGGYPPSRKAAS